MRRLAKHAYKGSHPIQIDVFGGDARGVEYCYLEGPHYYTFEPPPGADFVVTGGAYFYLGEPSRAFLDARPTFVGINAMYRPMLYPRPVGEVQPPAGWIGARVDLAPAVVVAPKVRGEMRVPRSGIRVGVEVVAPTIVIVPHGKFKPRGSTGSTSGIRPWPSERAEDCAQRVGHRPHGGVRNE